MRQWTIYIEAWAPPRRVGSLDPSDSRVGDFVKALIPHSGIVSADQHRWAAQITLPGPSSEEAIAAGLELLRTLATQCHLPQWPIERMEIVDVDRRDTELAVSNLPELIGTTEVAELLGMSRQRLHELRKAGRFPEPIVELAAGPIWLRSAVVAFEGPRERKPGRPAQDNSAKWAHELRSDYHAYTEHLADSALTRRQYPHQQDLIVHQLANRFTPQEVATVLGVPVEVINEALGRPGLE